MLHFRYLPPNMLCTSLPNFPKPYQARLSLCLRVAACYFNQHPEQVTKFHTSLVVIEHPYPMHYLIADKCEWKDEQLGEVSPDSPDWD